MPQFICATCERRRNCNHSAEDELSTSLCDHVEQANSRPRAGDTGGLLADDWITPETYKLELIHRLCPDPSKIEARPVQAFHDTLHNAQIATAQCVKSPALMSQITC